MAGENGAYLHVNALTAAAGAAVSGNTGAILKRVVINTAGAAANQLTIYDGTGIVANDPAAKVIAVANTTNAAVPSLDYNCVASRGIWYTLLTGTAADLTFVYQ